MSAAGAFRLTIACALLAGAGLVLAACGGEPSEDTGASGGARAEKPAASIEAARALLAAPPDPSAWFREEAVARGVDFTYRSGHRTRFLFPEIVGGGGAFFDLEGDGDLDLYLVQAGPIERSPSEREPNRLYTNDGQGLFTDVTDTSGADDRGYAMGVAAGDIDNDGDVDLYVTNVGKNVLLENLAESGSGQRFRDVTAGSGSEVDAWSVSSSFFDYDEDGLLDLFVTNYIFWSEVSERECIQPLTGPDYCSPKSYDAPAPDTLLHNEGARVFADVSSPMGLRTAFGNGLGCVASDFDGDGWLDIFVANDGMENQLWLNKAGTGFSNEALALGVAVDDDGKKKAGMGTAVADIDDDGDEDLIVVNLNMESDSLYENKGRYFKDASGRYGLRTVTIGYTRWGVGFHDFDDDGYLDLFEANGRVERPPDFDPGGNPYDEPNMLLRGNSGSRYFSEVSPKGGTVESLVHTSRAAVFGDVDGDGGVDVLVVNRDAPVELLHNVRAERGNWLRLRVVDAHGRDALGAKLEARLGERTLMRTVRTDSSYCAANDPGVHLGLGAATGIDASFVTWLDGTRESFGPREGGRTVTLVRGEGKLE